MSDEINEDSSSSASSSVAEEERVLRKGRWETWEDEILKVYIGKHGEGSWNSVEKNSGLDRSGKSCRLRWLYHLKPGLKKGPMTPTERDNIFRLQSRHGNKWSLMASMIPGRTDCHIKNYWYTRTKRHRRVGNQKIQNANRGDGPSEVLQSGVHDSGKLFIDSPRCPVNQNVLSRRSSEPGRFVPPNVSFSTPRPFTGTVRSELPSLQYPETDSSRRTSPPPPPYHAIPSYIQPTTMALSTQSDSASQSSSLLEAIVQESHTGSSVREQSSENSSNYSTMSPIYTPEYSLPDFSCIIGERSDDLYPPFPQPEVSHFMEYESNDGISLDDLSDFDRTLGLEKTEPSAGQTSTPDVVENDVSDAGDSQKPQ